MNCKNCPYNNGSGDKISRPVITHPQGNFLNLSIAITTRAVSVVDGVENVEEAEMDISNNLLGKPIVELTRGRKVYRYECDTFQNKVQFYDYGKLPAGSYDISVLLDYGDGQQMRYRKRTILRIVDFTDDGGQYENDEFNVIAIYPIVKGKTTAIILGDDDVIISENGKFKGDDTPSDNYADITATYGDSSIEVGEDDVTITI